MQLLTDKMKQVLLLMLRLRPKSFTAATIVVSANDVSGTRQKIFQDSTRLKIEGSDVRWWCFHARCSPAPTHPISNNHFGVITASPDRSWSFTGRYQMKTAEGSTADMALTMRKEVSQLELPKGFRFHPTDEELVMYYLCPKADSQPFSVQIIADVDIYKFDPWNLPERAVHGENEWYFFSPRDRKYPNGSRPNRSAGSGYWKATGTDKHISCAIDAGHGSRQKKKKLGVKKALVFYEGRAPNGTKTNWIMHEYRLAESARTASAKAAGPHSRRVPRKGSLRLDDWVLCRIYKKKSTTGSPTRSPTGDEKAEESDDMEDSIPEENIVYSSSIVEDFLASLPEIESSKLDQLQLLPNLDETSLSLLIDYDFQSMESVIIDHSPAGDLEDCRQS